MLYPFGSVFLGIVVLLLYGVWGIHTVSFQRWLPTDEDIDGCISTLELVEAAWPGPVLSSFKNHFFLKGPLEIGLLDHRSLGAVSPTSSSPCPYVYVGVERWNRQLQMCSFGMWIWNGEGIPIKELGSEDPLRLEDSTKDSLRVEEGALRARARGQKFSKFTYMSYIKRSNRVEYEPNSGWRENNSHCRNCDVDPCSALPLVQVGQNVIPQRVYHLKDRHTLPYLMNRYEEEWNATHMVKGMYIAVHHRVWNLNNTCVDTQLS